MNSGWVRVCLKNGFKEGRETRGGRRRIGEGERGKGERGENDVEGCLGFCLERGGRSGGPELRFRGRRIRRKAHWRKGG